MQAPRCGGRAMLTLFSACVDGFGEQDIAGQYRVLLDAYAKDITIR
jgi:phosphoglycolate phosphatase